MTAKITAVVLGLLVSVLPAATTATAETLGEVLARHDVRTTAGPALDRAITGYGMLDDPAVFCIAFYWQSGTESLGRELQVLAIDRSSGESRYATLVYGELIPDDPDFRTGAITRIMASPGYFYVGGHNSPSAGSVLVLSRELVFQTALSGWPLQTISNDAVVFHKSQVHFAAVHAAEIAIYNPHTETQEPLFPREPYQAFRSGHIEALRRAFAERLFEWFSQRNRPNDPARFDTTLAGSIAVSEDQDALAFVISYDNADLYSDETPPLPTRVVYVFRSIQQGPIEYREIVESQLAARVGANNLAELLDPRVLNRVFP